MRALPRSIFFDATAETVAFARIVVFGTWFAILLTRPLQPLAAFPRELAQMSGVMRALPAPITDNLLSAPGLAALWWTLLVLLSLVVVGARPFRALAVATAVLLLVYDGTVNAYGAFIGHAKFGLIYFALILALCPSADALCLWGSRRRRPRADYVATMVTIVALFSMAYAFVGGRRLATGPDVFLGDALPSWLATRSLEPSEYGFELGLLTLGHPVTVAAMKAGFIVITAFEVLTPAILLSDAFRRLWIAAMIPFHVATLLTMNIFFWENAVLILLLFSGLAYRVGVGDRHDAAPHPIVFFDGACGMCNRFVRNVMVRDSIASLRFAPLQGETARRVIGAQGANPDEWSLVLFESGRQYSRSDAALRILLRIGGGWGVVSSLLLYVPRSLRDMVYRMVASRRQQWFGQDLCATGMHHRQNVILP